MAKPKNTGSHGGHSDPGKAKRNLVESITTKTPGTVTDPPDDLAIGIGKIIVLWSFQVWLLQQITYALLDMDDARARVAIRDPRPEDHVTMIEDLMHLAGITTTVHLATLRTDLAELKRHRDNVAHNIYIRDEKTGKIQILLTAGKATGIGAPDLQSVSRRLVAEAQNINAAILENIRACIHDSAKRTTLLLQEVEAQMPTLPRRPQRRSVLDRPQDDPSAKTHPPQKKS